MRYATDIGLHFTTDVWHVICSEWSTWLKHYKPSIKLSQNALLLDAGAGEGESVLFLYMLGFRCFRCIELDPFRFSRLERNIQQLPGVEFTLVNRAFQSSDLIAVDFAKVDVEGGENELLKVPLSRLPKEIVLETHGPRVARALRRHLTGMTHSVNLGKHIDLWRFVNQSTNEPK